MYANIVRLFFLSTLFLTISCQNELSSDKANSVSSLIPQVSNPLKSYNTFNRDVCVERVKQKLKDREPLVIHIMVPLCDNDNQGIVKVNSRLGDGLNLKTNLYWGSKYGIKNFFHKLSPWKLIESKKDLNENILERIVLSRVYPNGAKVYLVADAYRGDKMKVCLTDYFNVISGKRKEQIVVNEQTISIKSNADLIIFNGHNGLMDYNINLVDNQDDKIRETAVIGCISQSYFLEHLKHAKAYPLLMTTNLMAPEAYVSGGLIDAWVQRNSDTEHIKKEVAKAYHKYQKCGIKGASRLFTSGWKK